MMPPQRESNRGAKATAQTSITKAIETENIYFELAADRLPLPGAVLAFMPDLTAIPAAAVVHRVDPDVIARERRAWLSAVERAFRDAHAAMARIYLDENHGEAGQVLAADGYRCREELVFEGSLGGGDSGISLRPLASAEDWECKRRFHEEAGCDSDGHSNPAGIWVDLERRKAAAGMNAYLADSGGNVVGSVGAVWSDGLLRFKNLLVHPDCRRTAVAQSMLTNLAEIGRRRGAVRQIALAVRSGSGELLYHSLGMSIIGRRFEWSKCIGGA